MDESLELETVEFADSDMMCESEVDCEGAPPPDAGVEHLSYDMMMDTGHDEIVGLDMDEYVGGVGADMPVLGGEEEVLTLPMTSGGAVATLSTPTITHQMSSVSMELEEMVSSVVQSPVKQSVPLRVVQPRGGTSTGTTPAHRPAASAAPPRPVQASGPRLGSAPREVAIAPKPAPGKPWAGGKLLALGGKQAVIKRVTIGDVVQGQLGSKQLVMVRGAPRFKLMPPNATGFQFIRADAPKQQGGGVRLVRSPAKVVAGEGGEAKVVSRAAPRYITVHQPGSVSVGAGVVGMVSQPVMRVKPRPPLVVALKSPPPRVVPAPPTVVQPTPAGVASKKVLVTGGAVLKPLAAGTAQIHQINVPGKGVQYIRVVSGAGGSRLVAARPPAPAAPAVSAADTTHVVRTQPGQRLVRIAPTKAQAHSLLAAPANAVQTSRVVSRPAQSLLAPRSPAPAPARAPPPALAPAPAPAPAPPADPVNTETVLQTLLEVEIAADAHHEDKSRGAASLIKYEENDSEAGRGEEEAEAEGGGGGGGAGADLDYDAAVSYLDRYLEGEVHQQSAGQDMSYLFNQSVDSNGGRTSKQPERPRKACNCTKSQCLKLYCDCFANGEFCNACNCANCHNNLDHEELRQKAIRSCLERNPNAFRPKIGKGKSSAGPEPVRRHNKGCNCKRSGCLKNYCECYEAKIACSAICRCVGCRNVEDGLGRLARADLPALADCRPAPQETRAKQPCSLMSGGVIGAVCQCLVAAAGGEQAAADPVAAVLDEFSRCLQDIIGAARHASQPLKA